MNPIDEKLEKLYKWKKEMIKKLFNVGIFLPYNVQLRDVFESLNICATYRFWNGQNYVGVNYSKPMINNSNPYYLFMYSDDAIWGSKSAYEQLPNYPYGGDLITKLDTIFRWKSTLAQEMKEGNCPLIQFTEDSSLNMLLAGVNYIVGGSRYIGTVPLMPKNIPLRADGMPSKYIDINEPIELRNLVPSTKTKYTLTKKDGKIYKYMSDYNNYNVLLKNGQGSNWTISLKTLPDDIRNKVMSDDRTQYDQMYARDNTDQNSGYYGGNSVIMYPYPNYKEDIKIEIGDKLKISLVNHYFNTFYKNGNAFKGDPDDRSRIYTGYEDNALQSIVPEHEINFIDHLPYKFNYYLVENTVDSKIDGLLGYKVNEVVNGNENSEAYDNMTRNHKRNTLSLFIDFTNDMKFLNPYELSQVVVPYKDGIKINNTNEFIEKGSTKYSAYNYIYNKLNLLNIFTDTSKMSTTDYESIIYDRIYDYRQNKERFNQDGVYYKHYTFNTSLNVYNFSGVHIDYYRNVFKDIKKYNGYGDLSPIMILKERNGTKSVWEEDYTAFEDSYSSRKLYGNDAWLFKKIRYNFYSTYEWNYYDITGNYSSYLLGVFPVKDNDVIDYDNPIMYRHIIPDVAYKAVLNREKNNNPTKYKILLNDVFDRKNTSTYEFNDSDSEEKLYENTPPVSSFFHRNSKSSNLVNNDNFADPKGYIGVSNKINNYANIQIPSDMGKIAIKLYHSIPLLNVPKVLRDYKYNAPNTIPFKDVKGNIENTIYNGQEIDTQNTRRPDATYKTNELVTKYTPYLYDITEDILNTKALIIDPNKATYDNLPLLRNDIRYKIVKVTENAIFICTEFECDDKFLDILYETAKCWVTLSDGINDNKIFPDSMEILPEYSVENIIGNRSSSNYSYLKDYNEPKDTIERSLAYNYRKVLKININLDLFNISEMQNKVKDVLHKEDSKLYSITNNKTTNNDFYLDDMIYINFSMSNTLFSNEDILNYDNMYKDVDYKEYLGELDNQFMFRTITPKDEDKQKTSNLELRKDINTNKRFSTSGIYANTKDYIKDGTSEIIYSIGLTPLTMAKILYKDRNYITKNDRTLIKPFLNGLPLSCPPLVRKSEYSKDIPKGKVITNDELGRIKNDLSTFPFNIDEMTMDEVENLFDTITTKREEEQHSIMLGYTTDEVSYYSNNRIFMRNRNTNTKENKNVYMKNIERNSNDTQVSKENAKIYSYNEILNDNSSYKDVILMILLYYYMIQPKVLFYNGVYNKDTNGFDFLVCVENEEDRLKRLDEFFKDVRGEENLYNFTRDYKDYSVVALSRNNSNLSFNKTWYTGRYDTYSGTNWQKSTLASFSSIQHSRDNLYYIKQNMLNFYKKFNSDWLFIYTPGLNKEKDKYIAKILYSYIPAIIYFIKNEILKYANTNYNNSIDHIKYGNINFDKIFLYLKNAYNSYNTENIIGYIDDVSSMYKILEDVFKKVIDDEEYKELYSITLYNNTEKLTSSPSNPIKYYKDFQMSLINTKELLSYETFRKSDINNKYVDNILMGKTADFASDIKQFPKDAKAVVVNIPIDKCHNNNIHNTFNNTISNMVNLLKEYNKINKSIIVIIECVANNSNNISINYDKPNLVEDNSIGNFTNMLKRISGFIKNYVNNTNLVIDGLYFKFNNFLMAPMCIKNINDTNNVQFVYKLNNMEKALLKKNMVLGINYMEFPNTLEEFKDVMDNNYHDIISLLKNGTVKYYKLGIYEIPEEYNDKLEKIKSLIGYRIALHNMYKIIDQNSRENIFQNSRSSFYLDIVSLSRCGIYDNHYKRKNVDYFIYDNMQYFSNIDTRLKLSIELESKYRYDNTSIIKTTLDKNTFTNTVNSNVIENRISNDIVCKYIRNNNTTDIWDSLNMNTFVDFTRISLQMRTLSTEVTLKNNHPLYLGTTSTYKLRPASYDPSTQLYSDKEEDGKTALGTAKFNAYNMSSFSPCNVFLNLRTTPTTNTNGQANTYGATLWGSDDSYIHLSNMNQEENNGVLINSFRTDAMFFDMPNN